MAKFSDANGVERTLAIPNFGAVIRWRKEGRIDLNKVGNDSGALFDLLRGDTEQMLRAAHLLSGREEEFDDFADALGSDHIEQAREALLEAILDFFHHRRAKEIRGAFVAMILSPSGSNETAANSAATSA